MSRPRNNNANAAIARLQALAKKRQEGVENVTRKERTLKDNNTPSSANQPNGKAKADDTSGIRQSNNKLPQSVSASSKDFEVIKPEPEIPIPQAQGVTQSDVRKMIDELKRAKDCETLFAHEIEPEVDYTKFSQQIQDIVSFESECEKIYEMKQTKVKSAKRLDLARRIAKVVGHIKGVKLIADSSRPELGPLIDFQWLSIPETINRLGCLHGSAMCIMPTGSGKTFHAGFSLRKLEELFPELWTQAEETFIVTKPSIKTQTLRVIVHDFKNKKCPVKTYADFTVAGTSGLYIKWSNKVDSEGRPVMVPEWDDFWAPKRVILDEIQVLKNDSEQSEVFRKFPGQVIGYSATPGSKPRHFKSIAILMRLVVQYTYGPRLITQDSFDSWCRDECGLAHATPDQWNPEAMRRIMNALEPHVIRFDKIQYRKRTLIKQMVIDFVSQEEHDLFWRFFEEWKRIREEIEMKPEMHPATAKLVAMQKFREKAEHLRVPRIAQMVVNTVATGRSVIVATSFACSMDSLYEILTRPTSEGGGGLDKDNIAVIRGGQTLANRQINIDEFQSDKRHVMLLMFSAGGAGLSLHQTNNENKRSRVVYLPPVWNAEELVQVLGRAHRVNSDSTTYQYIVWYGGTIEEEVAEKVKRKCSSLKEVVGKKEDWTEAFSGKEIGSGYKTHDDEGKEIDDDEEPLAGDLPVCTDEDEVEKSTDDEDDSDSSTLVNDAN